MLSSLDLYITRSHEDSASSQDHTTDVVPLKERRGMLTMGLLWITMVTGFPSVLIGFDWYKAGLTLPQLLACVSVSCLILLAYTIPVAMLGSKSGQTYGLLSRNVFGRWGSYLVSGNLVWLCIAWYGLNAIYLAEGLKGLFHWQAPLIIMAMVLAVLMAFNNLFGFAGVANFARFLAAPVLIAWVGYTFCKASLSCPPMVLSQVSHQPFASCLTLVSSFVIGYSIWGNEADYWRYGQPKVGQIVIPLVVAVVIGEIIFPSTGWMIAHLTGVTDYAAATDLMNRYAFGGITVIAALVLMASYFAVNDSGLYGAINALENIREMPRKAVVAGLMLSGVLTAGLLSQYARAFEMVASLTAVILPSGSLIMVVEYFLIARMFKRTVDFSRVSEFDEIPICCWSAVIALSVGCLVGVATSGLIPALEPLHVGVCSLQAWIAAICTYVPLRIIEERKKLRHTLFLDRLLQAAGENAADRNSMVSD